MKTNEVYNKGIQTYEDIFGKEHHKICEGVDCVCHTAVKSFIKTLTLDILKAEIERLEGEFYIKNGASMCENRDNALGYNQAIQEQIDYYQEQIKEINQ